MEDNIFFIDKVVLVTGSSRGIGKAIATAFAKLGCKVVINSNSNIDQLKETYEELLKINPNVKDVLLGFGLHCLGCPMSQMETLEQACQVHGLDLDFVLDRLNGKA